MTTTAMRLRLFTLGLTCVLLALAQSPGPAFDVVSIKPRELPPGQFSFRMRIAAGPPVPHATGNRYAQNQSTLQDLIMDAYGVYDYQISGLTDWMVSPRGAHFDIDARAEGDAVLSPERLQLMLQNMLADRFQLRLHREMRPLPVYALVVKDATKIHEITKEEFDTQPRYSRPPEKFPETMMTTITAFSGSVRRNVDRPVLDETGLTGYYRIATPEWMQPNRDRTIDPVSAQAAVFSELESRDGLKLEPRKDATEVLVIDHAEKPSAN